MSVRMRFFASSHRLDQLTPRTRILTTLLLLGMLGQALSGIAMHHLGPGWTPSSIATHYRGDEGEPTVADPLAPLVFHEPKPLAALVDIAHMHLFAMPLAIFLVAHLFSMGGPGRTRAGGVLCYLAFAAAFTDIAAPFLVRYGGAGFAAFKLAAFVVLMTCYLALIVMTLIGCLRTFGGRSTPPPHVP
ncbi:MAG TPA: hypothetical protein VEL07_19755 [Planctomycetota bacterium]|nr:hypothetical protein [Planctomycetota bacterium]